jgi:ribosomal-protein-alanine N-acetyltransferase
MSVSPLRTARLELIAATAESLALELHDLPRFATALGVTVPDNWPPPLNDEASQRWYLDMLQRDSDAVGWALWYLIASPGHRQIVGVAGFKGCLSGGACEIGYSILPPFQGCGYATEAVRRLIAWAFEHADVDAVIAETMPELRGSIRVMEKCGMRFEGAGNPEEGQATLRFRIGRDSEAVSLDSAPKVRL